MKYDKDMDSECVALCDVLNDLPGISTVQSCCGHGVKPFCVWFSANSLKDLPAVLYWFDSCHTFPGWNVFVTTDCAMSPVTFRIEGPLGAYGDLGIIVERVRLHKESEVTNE